LREESRRILVISHLNAFRVARANIAGSIGDQRDLRVVALSFSLLITYFASIRMIVSVKLLWDILA
jgi:hypothetical protein